MSNYMVEFINRRGNKFREDIKSKAEARIIACRMIKKCEIDECVAIIHDRTNYKQIEKIWYDSDPGYAGYSTGNAGYWIQSYETHRRQRVSPKTGKLLDVSKCQKYI